MEGLEDADLLEFVRAAEGLGRMLDGIRVRSAGEVHLRSDPGLGQDRLSARRGCRTGPELLQRLTLLPHRSLKRRWVLDERTRSSYSVSGSLIDPRCPLVAEALHDGDIGDETASLVSGMLARIAPRALPGMMAAAEENIVDAATGRLPAETDRPGPEDDSAGGADDGGDGRAPAMVFEAVRVMAGQWEAAADPDGPEPSAEQAAASRCLTFRPLKDGLVGVSGRLLPEVAAQWRRLDDAHMNPATHSPSPGVDMNTSTGTGVDAVAGASGGGTGASLPDFLPTGAESAAAAELAPGLPGPVADERTPGQKRHDVLASILGAAARSAATPNLGGDTATLVVHVNAQDLADPHGYAQVEGIDVPVSARIAHRLACTAAVQKVVFDTSGRIVRLGSKERAFTAHQRRAIAARDGGCIIPGCMIPASWCEVHHVTPWAEKGSTHVENGCLLCFYHHRSIEDSGWGIEMRSGVPWVRAPGWINPTGVFRPAPSSLTRYRAGLTTRLNQASATNKLKPNISGRTNEDGRANDTRTDGADGNASGGGSKGFEIGPGQDPVDPPLWPEASTSSKPETEAKRRRWQALDDPPPWADAPAEPKEPGETDADDGVDGTCPSR
ncbi:hypothetical protein BJH93_06000 [Kocuria polaris]|nr:hypothetical protein [Kocuria polaris]